MEWPYYFDAHLENKASIRVAKIFQTLNPLKGADHLQHADLRFESENCEKHQEILYYLEALKAQRNPRLAVPSCHVAIIG